MHADDAKNILIDQLRDQYATRLADIYSRVEVSARNGGSSTVYVASASDAVYQKLDVSRISPLRSTKASDLEQLAGSLVSLTELLPYVKVLQADGYSVAFANIQAALRFNSHVSLLHTRSRARETLLETERIAGSASGGPARSALQEVVAASGRLLQQAESDLHGSNSASEVEIVISW